MHVEREGSQARDSSVCSATTLTCALTVTRQARLARGDTAPPIPCSVSSPEWTLVREPVQFAYYIHSWGNSVVACPMSIVAYIYLYILVHMEDMEAVQVDFVLVVCGFVVHSSSQHT